MLQTSSLVGGHNDLLDRMSCARQYNGQVANSFDDFQNAMRQLQKTNNQNQEISKTGDNFNKAQLCGYSQYSESYIPRSARKVVHDVHTMAMVLSQPIVVLSPEDVFPRVSSNSTSSSSLDPEIIEHNSQHEPDKPKELNNKKCQKHSPSTSRQNVQDVQYVKNAKHAKDAHNTKHSKNAKNLTNIEHQNVQDVQYVKNAKHAHNATKHSKNSKNLTNIERVQNGRKVHPVESSPSSPDVPYVQHVKYVQNLQDVRYIQYVPSEQNVPFGSIEEEQQQQQQQIGQKQQKRKNSLKQLIGSFWSGYKSRRSKSLEEKREQQTSGQNRRCSQPPFVGTFQQDRRTSSSWLREGHLDGMYTMQDMYKMRDEFNRTYRSPQNSRA